MLCRTFFFVRASNYDLVAFPVWGNPAAQQLSSMCVWKTMICRSYTQT